jgi:hypothetical protein
MTNIIKISDYKKKDCIFKRLSHSTSNIKKHIEGVKLYGYPLLSYIFDEVDSRFKEYSDNQKDIIIMRIYDNLEREGGQFYF